ncbi:MAG: hypothetical protein IKC10_08445 [Alphaproteobacteria bacterium]|nr:hypothetical protein [Alphaproteobacteria bacterium]
MEIKWTALALDILPDKYASQTKDGIMTIDVTLSRTHSILQVTVPEALTQTSCPNKELIKALSKAFKYQKILISGRMTIAERSLHEELDAGYLGRILRTKEALLRVRAEGKILGRPKGRQSTFVKLSGRENKVKELIEQKVSKSAMARILGVHRITVAKFIRDRVK